MRITTILVLSAVTMFGTVSHVRADEDPGQQARSSAAASKTSDTKTPTVDEVFGPGASEIVAASYSSLTPRMRSFNRHQVAVRFYSLNRSVVWPSQDRVYLLKDYEVHQFPLSCVAGERICYGAWAYPDRAKTWGLGTNKRNGCTTCCFVCDGAQTRIVNLND